MSFNDTASDNSTTSAEENLFSFVTEGVLLTSISILGLVGNAMSVYVLLKPSVRGIFSNLLTSLASFDGLFLLSAIFTFGLPALSEEYKRNVFMSVMPVTYGLSHTFRVGSVYSTLSVTLERFFAIVLPFRDFRHVKKWLLPATATFAIVYNVPKFFELTTETDSATNETYVVGSSLRRNPHYVSLYVFWSKFLLIELIPYVAIVILNSFILIKIIKSSRFRQRVMSNMRCDGGAIEMEIMSPARSDSSRRAAPSRTGSSSRGHPTRTNSSRFTSVSEEQIRFFEKQRQEHKLGGLLIAISVLFIACQSFKIIPDLYEMLFCYGVKDCQSTPVVTKIVDLSHLLVCFNSSANCIVYLFGGEKFRRAWFQTYCPRCCAVAAAAAAAEENQDVGRSGTIRSRLTVNSFRGGSGHGRDNGRNVVVADRNSRRHHQLTVRVNGIANNEEDGCKRNSGRTGGGCIVETKELISAY